MTLHALIQYIRYKWKAKTRHGIHSPFVYAFIDDCLAKKSTQNLEERINAYFGDTIKWSGEGFEVEPGDSVFVLGVKNIHRTKENTNIWDNLSTNLPGFIISIDLFSIGLLIYNPDIKEKQHFVLQYPL